MTATVNAAAAATRSSRAGLRIMMAHRIASSDPNNADQKPVDGDSLYDGQFPLCLRNLKSAEAASMAKSTSHPVNQVAYGNHRPLLPSLLPSLPLPWRPAPVYDQSIDATKSSSSSIGAMAGDARAHTGMPAPMRFGLSSIMGSARARTSKPIDATGYVFPP